LLLRFVAEGAYVFITGRRQTELDAAVNEIGKNVTGIQGDVSNLADLDRLYATIEQKQVTWMVFANAGVGQPSRSDRSPKNTLTKHSTQNVNVFTVQKALPLIPEVPSS